MNSTNPIREGYQMAATEKSLPVQERSVPTAGERSARILPPVLRMREQIDEVFTRFVGPIATELCLDEFNRWRTEGQIGPGGLHRYISRLARYISDDPSRHEFIKYASRCIRLSAAVKS